MKDGLTLSKREETRLRVLTEVAVGTLGLPEAAQLMGVGQRQAWRLLATLRRDGARGLGHSNRGREPANKVTAEKRERILQLAKTTYAGANRTHLSELLAEHEKIQLSPSTIGRVLSAGGVSAGKRRRRSKHRSRRERFVQEGMLAQVDGSDHAWLEERGPRLVLLGAIDDATGKVLAARFATAESTESYFALAADLIAQHGRPYALYSDKHAVFRSTQPETRAEQLTGKREPTQFGRAMEQLGVQIICANSPQAKGRIERLWGTLQDRLVVELRIAGIDSMEGANGFLEGFLRRFNASFAVSATIEGTAFRSLPDGVSLDAVLCPHHRRRVARDNTVQVDGQLYQLLRGPRGEGYAGLSVTLQLRRNGQPVALRGTDVIAMEALAARPQPAVAIPTPPPAAPAAPRTPHKPPPTHPWKRSLKTRPQLAQNARESKPSDHSY